MARIGNRGRAVLAAVAGIGTLVACDDATGIQASFNNVEREDTVFAMNGSPITATSAIAVRSASAVRMDAGFLFDLALDIGPGGEVIVYTQARVASELVATHRVGLQMSATPYSELLRAPGSGYVYDSLLTVPVGGTFVVDVIEQACSNAFLGPNIRAKFRVDSINLATRAIHLHGLANPNCGFRSLVQGEPKD